MEQSLVASTHRKERNQTRTCLRFFCSFLFASFLSVGRTSEVRWRFSFSVYFALAKGLFAQVCFSFGQVDLPWLRHVLFGRGSLGAPSVNADPKSLHDVMFYATVAEVAEILRSAQACNYAQPHMRSLIVDHDVKVAAELDAKSQSEVESGKHLRCRWWK